MCQGQEQKDYMKRIKDSDYTCIVIRGEEEIYHSRDKGVKPLMDYIKQHEQLESIKVLDKIVGKGAMVLAIKSKANEVITPTISQKALDLAKKYHIDVQYDKVVPYIINRTGTGPCPIESAVGPIDQIEEAYKVIITTLAALRQQVK